jgi:Flp pilus assembly protein TadG
VPVEVPTRLRDDRGQALAEFALVLPLLLAVVTAIAEFGLTFNRYLTLTDAARSGARVAAVSADTADPVGTAKAAVRAAAADLDQTKLDPQVSPLPWNAGNPVTVTARYPYTISIFGFSVYSGTLTSSTTERVE